ncbi:MAG: glycosyltransferase family 4 protein [Acidobacteriota bacterium]
MRILHLATFLQGGAGRAIVDLVLEQHAAGHDVTVVVSGSGAPGYGNYQAYLDELIGRHIPVRLVDSMFERTHAPNLAVVNALDQMYPAGEEPQVIHAHAAIPSFVALLFAGSRHGASAILQTMHGWGLVKTSDQVATDVSVLNLVDRVVVPSGHSAGILAALGVSPTRITMLPYGVRPETRGVDDEDLDTLAAMIRARHRGALVVACVGTFNHRKNQTLLVDAIGRLADMPVLGVFVGDGDQDDLRAAIAAHECGERVRVHGYSRGARQLAAAADLLVLPSRSEGQPIAVLEAFCDGTLVAVSDIPELVELVDGGLLGFMFRSDDPEDLAGTLRNFARLPASTRRLIRQRARTRYGTRFTVAAMASGYLELYQTLVTAVDGRRRESPAA